MFDGTDYKVWRLLMELLLKEHEVNTVALEKEQPKQGLSGYGAFAMKYIKFQSLIAQHLHDNLIMEIKECQSAKEM